MATLYELRSQFEELLSLIQQGEYDKDTLKDTLEGLEGEIEIKADGYAKIIKELDGNIETIEKEINRLKSKKNSYENSINSLKCNLEDVMLSTGKTKFKTELFSFSIQKNTPKLIITGEVPKKYLIKQEPKVDNAAIKEILKSKRLLYAHLEQSESLRIR